MSELTVPELAADTNALAAALAYAAAGWHVGPLRNGSKHPGSRLGKGWQVQTSREPEVITAWFAGTDDGVFLHLGRSGALAFDVDRPDLLPEPLSRAVAQLAPPHQSTRSGTPGRGHYLFAFRDRRVLGNGTGRLGGAWGECRGRNGVIVAAPTRHEKDAAGGRYTWVTTGEVPELPDYLDALLDDAGACEGAAADAEVEAFLAEHTGTERPELLEVWARVFTGRVAAGESRHMRMLSVATGAMKEAAAGYVPARLAADTLEGLFLAAVGADPVPGSEQRAARAGAGARSEWAGILAWAVAQAKTANLDEVRGRAGQKIPDVTAWSAGNAGVAGIECGPSPRPAGGNISRGRLAGARLVAYVHRSGDPAVARWALRRAVQQGFGPVVIDAIRQAATSGKEVA